MHDRLVHANLFSIVTCIAEFISLFCKDQFRDYPVPEVAILASFLFDNSMYDFVFEVFFSEGGMAFKAALAHHPSLCGRTSSNIDTCANKKEHQYPKVSIPSWKQCHFFFSAFQTFIIRVPVVLPKYIVNFNQCVFIHVHTRLCPFQMPLKLCQIYLNRIVLFEFV